MITEGQFVWVVKYALTDGVRRTAATKTSDNEYVLCRSINAFWSFKIGKDVFLTEEEALQAAEKMRLKKIKSLQKQIKKLEEMRFDPKEG